MSGPNCVVSGVTLFECLIVLTLFLIFSVSVLVSYRSFVFYYQKMFVVNSLVNALQYARDEAMTLHTGIIFCAKDINGNCGTQWANGQLIMRADNQVVLRVLPALPKNIQLSWRSTLGDDALRWRSDGFTDGQQGTFFIDGYSKISKVIILRTGRLRVE